MSPIVKDYMKPASQVVTKDCTLEKLIKKMVEKGTNSLVVVENMETMKPIGMVSTANVIKEVIPDYLEDNPSISVFEAENQLTQFAERAKTATVEKFMLPIELTLHPNDSLLQAAAYSTQRKQRAIPVQDDAGHLVGIVTRTSIKNAIYHALFPDSKDQMAMTHKKDN